MRYLVLTLILGISLEATLADEKASKKEALELIAITADQICNQNLPHSSHSKELSASGSAKAEIGSLVKKLVDLGIEGAGNYKSSETQGVLQKELARSIESQSNCKQGVFYSLLEIFIPAEKNVNPFASSGNDIQIPEPLSSIRSGQRFSMKINDARLISGTNTVITLTEYSGNNPPLIRITYTDMIEGGGGRIKPSLGTSADMGNCKITYYAANSSEGTASFYLSCK